MKDYPSTQPDPLMEPNELLGEIERWIDACANTKAAESEDIWHVRHSMRELLDDGYESIYAAFSHLEEKNGENAA